MLVTMRCWFMAAKENKIFNEKNKIRQKLKIKREKQREEIIQKNKVVKSVMLKGKDLRLEEYCLRLLHFFFFF